MIYIGCEAYITPYPPEDVVYHAVDSDERAKNKLKTKCGITGLMSFWFVREGSFGEMNCENCIEAVEETT